MIVLLIIVLYFIGIGYFKYLFSIEINFTDAGLEPVTKEILCAMAWPFILIPFLTWFLIKTIAKSNKNYKVGSG